MAIRSFRDKDTERLFGLLRVARWTNIERPALRKLKQLDLARRLDDLRIPPANHLEALKGERKGQHSIRINDQYRVCFRWNGIDAEDVEIVDYH
ncbi:MAG: type II toxin-antitoxin system RelE/ParE family toxin [Proteobacteria bacterium]|nr:type II toxin-antitoxin system RelE/ParE family toxin [Pseudomonadota bacterium]